MRHHNNHTQNPLLYRYHDVVKQLELEQHRREVAEREVKFWAGLAFVLSALAVVSAIVSVVWHTLGLGGWL